jgi:hypothetical protein
MYISKDKLSYTLTEFTYPTFTYPIASKEPIINMKAQHRDALKLHHRFNAQSIKNIGIKVA